MSLLEQLSHVKGQYLMTTFDAAAEWVDAREVELFLESPSCHFV